MNNIITYKKFSNNGNQIREKEDLTYTIFEDIDFFETSDAVSFFRSDFRGSKFTNMYFYKNNFDRADFISCVFDKCRFKNVNIASSEIKNCYFRETIFTTNLYNNTSIQECTFEKCTFLDEKLLVNMKNCKFVDCEIINVSFEGSTTESITFDNCKIIKSDLATMHAERYMFKSCVLKDVSIGISYIFGYLFYNTNIHDMDILYRGEQVSLSQENAFKQYIISLWQNGRYYEFINANVIYKNFETIPSLLEKSLADLIENQSQIRKLEVCNILDMLLFYFMNNVFPFEIYLKISETLDDFSWNKFNFDEYLVYYPKVQQIKMMLSSRKYDDKFIMSATESISFVTFHCKTEDYEKALSISSECLKSVCEKLGIDNSFKLIDSQKGSWLITFAVVSACALLLPKIVKSYSGLIFEINTKRQLSKRLSDKLDQSNLSINDLKLIADTAASSGIISANGDKFEISDLVDLIKIGI